MEAGFFVDRLGVCVYPSSEEMGGIVADVVAQQLRSALSTRTSVRLAFAAAASQTSFLQHLIEQRGIDWHRVEAVHLDEYVGLPPNHPSSFRRWLAVHLFEQVPIRRVEFLNGSVWDLAAECSRYEAILRERPPDFAFLGIGENGHLAFNDPHEANFHESRLVKVVELDAVSRAQQVRDGAFTDIDDVPVQALTLTIPALMAADSISVIVSGVAKARAVQRTLSGSVSSRCPASILRRHPQALLHVDEDAIGLARKGFRSYAEMTDADVQS
jgi:glucosamine-6-phosphate deaminase